MREEAEAFDKVAELCVGLGDLSKVRFGSLEGLRKLTKLDLRGRKITNIQSFGRAHTVDGTCPRYQPNYRYQRRMSYANG